MNRSLAAGLLFCILSHAAQSQETVTSSPNCVAPTVAREHTICSDPRVAELDRVLASALARAQSHPRKAQISKLTRELNALRRECDSDPQCIKDLQRSLIHHYMDDFGLTFSLPAWAASEGISANARCRGTALTDLSSFPFTLRKGDDIDFVAYEDNGSERSYIVDRMGRIGAANIRLKDPRCILRRY